MTVDPFVRVPETEPTGPEMAQALRAVNPWTPTALTLSADVWSEIEPHYERLQREARTAKRAAWRRWHAAIAPICARLEHE